MKKALIVSLILVIAALFFAGCTDTEGNSYGDAPMPENVLSSRLV